MNNQNHKGTLTESEIKGLEEWPEFNTEKGLYYKKYASDILNYRPLFDKELNSTKILILIKLWENKSNNETYQSLETLAIASGINITLVSTYIHEMTKSKLPCQICGQEFGILEITGSHKYENNKEGNLYSLNRIESLLKHITNIHNKPNPKEFRQTLLNLINAKPKKQTIKEQRMNLKNNKEKKNEF